MFEYRRTPFLALVYAAVIGYAVTWLVAMPDRPMIGLPLLLPFSRRKSSLYLWADTGHSGWFALTSTYQQAWTWITEGGMFVVLAARCYQLGVWPFD